MPGLLTIIDKYCCRRRHTRNWIRMYTSPVIYIYLFSCVYSRMSKKRWGTWGHDDREDDNPWKKRKWGANASAIISNITCTLYKYVRRG